MTFHAAQVSSPFPTLGVKYSSLASSLHFRTLPLPMSSRGKGSPPVHQIKAIYEGFSNAPLAPSYPGSRPASPIRSQADSTMVKTELSEVALLTPEPSDDIADTIDTVLEVDRPNTPPPSTPTRPKNQQRPSWIGPSPSGPLLAPQSAAMARKVTVTYAAPGLRPPVFVTTSLSNPAWELIEMHASKRPGGEYFFALDFDAEPGEHGYKFRLGPGDWWVCDESRPIVDDGSGHRNNLLVVEHDPLVAATARHQPDDAGLAMESDRLKPGNDPKSETAPSSTHSPTLDHELHQRPTAVEVVCDETPSRSHQHDDHEDHEHERSPLFAHENHFASKPLESFDPENDVMMNPRQDDGDDDDVFEDPPLLRHETLSSDSAEEEQAPLFRHEFTFPSQRSSEQDDVAVFSSMSSSSSRSSFDGGVCPEADPDDPSLERFPVHKAGIMHEIHRASKSMPEDQTSEEGCSRSPQRSASSASMLSSPPLPDVIEEGESEDEDDGKPDDLDTTDMDEAIDAATCEMVKAPETPPLTPERHMHSSRRRHSSASSHHHPAQALEDMTDEREVNEKKLTQADHRIHVSPRQADIATTPGRRGFLAEACEVLFGIGLAAAVAALAVVLWWTKTSMRHDAAENGGATMES